MPTSPHRRRWLRLAGLLAGLLGVLSLAVFFGGQWALGRYIESDAFRSTLDRTSGSSLRAVAEFAPLHLSGSDLSGDGVQARGYEDAAFTRAEVRQFRAHWSLRKLWDRVCQLENVEAGELTISLEGSRLPRPAPVEPVRKVRAGSSWLSSLAPNRVEVSTASIRRAGLSWEGGRLRGVALEATAENSLGRPSEWKVTGHGGVLEAGAWPPLELQELRLRYHEPTLYVEKADFREGAAGTLALDGEATPGEALDLHGRWSRLPLDLLLTPDWRQHLHGTLSGEASARSPLPLAGPVTISGQWSLVDGRLEALPVLNDLATFTGTAQFRNLALSRAGGDFRFHDGRLELSRSVLEANGLARLEGSCTLEGEKIDATLQFGLAPNLLQWLPGARSQVFATARDGYQWTPVRVTGTLTAPHEDLTARLVNAAAGEVLGTALQGAGEVRQKAQETAKGVLDLLFGK